jgi:hypothetical protein
VDKDGATSTAYGHYLLLAVGKAVEGWGVVWDYVFADVWVVYMGVDCGAGEALAVAGAEERVNRKNGLYQYFGFEIPLLGGLWKI